MAGKQQDPGFLKTTGAAINAGVNMALLGLPNWAVGKAMGSTPEQMAAFEAQRDADAGAAGSAAKAIGLVYGLGKLKALAGGAKVAAREVPAALNYMGPITPTAGALAKGALKYGGLPLAAGLGFEAMRTGDGGALPAAAPAAALAAAPMTAAALDAQQEPTVATPFLASMKELIAGGGGNMGLDQLASLSGSFNNMIPAAAKPTVSAKDRRDLTYQALVEKEYNEALANAQAAGNPQAELEARATALAKLAGFDSPADIPGLSPAIK